MMWLLLIWILGAICFIYMFLCYILMVWFDMLLFRFDGVSFDYRFSSSLVYWFKMFVPVCFEIGCIVGLP